jgi:S-formylglutathione hydrolase FrmB
MDRMSRLLSLLIVCAALFASPAARAGGVVETGLEAPSPLLGHPIRYALYKPAAAPPQGRRWPVLFLLHGLSGSDADWLKVGRIAATLDRQIAAGQIQPLVVVMPMAGDSWYVDNSDPGGAGPIAQALTTDLVAAIDSRVPTAPCREARAVGGLSMGGYGALLYALDHPDVYSAVISLSGSIFAEMPSDAQERAKRRFRRFGNVFGDPFDWQRMNAWNLFPRVARLAQEAKPPSIWLEAGDKDYPPILEGTVRLHLDLRKAGIDSELRVDDGGHDWHLWSTAIAPALEWLSPRLDATCGTARPPAGQIWP